MPDLRERLGLLSSPVLYAAESPLSQLKIACPGLIFLINAEQRFFYG
jgi:hypothetical protein